MTDRRKIRSKVDYKVSSLKNPRVQFCQTTSAEFCTGESGEVAGCWRPQHSGWGFLESQLHSARSKGGWILDRDIYICTQSIKIQLKLQQID